MGVAESELNSMKIPIAAAAAAILAWGVATAQTGPSLAPEGAPGRSPAAPPPDATTDIWSHMTSEQRKRLWQQLTPEERANIWGRLQSSGARTIQGRDSVPEQTGPATGPKPNPEERRQFRDPVPEQTGPATGPKLSPEERRQLREQIREQNRQGHGVRRMRR